MYSSVGRYVTSIDRHCSTHEEIKAKKHWDWFAWRAHQPDTCGDNSSTRPSCSFSLQPVSSGSGRGGGSDGHPGHEDDERRARHCSRRNCIAGWNAFRAVCNIYIYISISSNGVIFYIKTEKIIKNQVYTYQYILHI